MLCTKMAAIVYVYTQWTGLYLLNLLLNLISFNCTHPAYQFSIRWRSYLVKYDGQAFENLINPWVFGKKMFFFPQIPTYWAVYVFDFQRAVAHHWKLLFGQTRHPSQIKRVAWPEGDLSSPEKRVVKLVSLLLNLPYFKRGLVSLKIVIFYSPPVRAFCLLLKASIYWCALIDTFLRTNREQRMGEYSILLTGAETLSGTIA